MSKFGTISPISEGLPGTAPQVFVASTVDNLATITATGYLDDLGDLVKQNDVFYINYSDTSVQPLGGVSGGEAATLGEFYANVSGGHMNLVNALTALGQAAAKAVTDNTKPSVASVDGTAGTYTIGDILLAGDTNGSIGADSGYNVNNLVQYASVAITAAQFNAMYATPFLLIAAPGANKLIVVDHMELVMTFGAADFAAGGVVAAQYDSTAHGAGVLATNSEAAADFFAAASTTFVFNRTVVLLPFATTVNKGIYLSNATNSFTTGDSTFVAKLHYRIIATA